MTAHRHPLPPELHLLALAFGTVMLPAMRLHNLLLLAIVISTAAALSCMDDNGSPVDWFAFIKINSSFSYAYMDANSPSFRQSNFQSSSATSGALSHTLSPLYAGSDTSHIFYNDEKPSGSTSSTRAHAKGETSWFAQVAVYCEHNWWTSRGPVTAAIMNVVARCHCNCGQNG